MMKILHIVPISGNMVAKNYIRFIRENFNYKDHTFITIGEPYNDVPNEMFVDDSAVIHISSYTNIFKIMRLFFIYDKILYHALTIPPKTKLALLLFPVIMNKIVWIAWGYDIYQWKTNGHTLKYKTIDKVEYIFRRRIRCFVGIFPPDIDYYKKTFQSRARTYYATYVGALYIPFYHKKINSITLAEKINKGDCINILIGHQCNPILNHIEVLESLARFKGKYIKLYIPLSYGDIQYGNQVEEKAKLIFGEKAVCIREMMNIDVYLNFLSTIDIAIFNTSRQIGLGNIHPLFYMEKKIFIPAGTTMYDYFRSVDINICDYSLLRQMSYINFIGSVDMKKAKQYVITNIVNKSTKLEMWTKVFNSPMK